MFNDLNLLSFVIKKVYILLIKIKYISERTVRLYLISLFIKYTIYIYLYLLHVKLDYYLFLPQICRIH